MVAYTAKGLVPMYQNGANQDARIMEVVREVIQQRVMYHCWSGLREAAQMLGTKDMNPNTPRGKKTRQAVQEMLEEAEALLMQLPAVAERGDT